MDAASGTCQPHAKGTFFFVVVIMSFLLASLVIEIVISGGTLRILLK
ncbi:MAG: hypothetical protein QNL80_08505 [Akkermansiaceae bacterium]|nr:hypothetical protein [Akkermansiaceae bacterium]